MIKNISSHPVKDYPFPKKREYKIEDDEIGVITVFLTSLYSSTFSYMQSIIIGYNRKKLPVANNLALFLFTYCRNPNLYDNLSRCENLLKRMDKYYPELKVNELYYKETMKILETLFTFC